MNGHHVPHSGRARSSSRIGLGRVAGLSGRSLSVLFFGAYILAAGTLLTFFAPDFNRTLSHIAQALQMDSFRADISTSAALAPVIVGLGVQYLVCGLMDGGRSATTTIFTRAFFAAVLSSQVVRAGLPPVLHIFSILDLLSASVTAMLGYNTIQLKASARGMLMSVFGCYTLASGYLIVHRQGQQWMALNQYLSKLVGLVMMKEDPRTAIIIGSVIMAFGLGFVLSGLQDDPCWAKASVISSSSTALVWAWLVHTRAAPSIVLLYAAINVAYAMLMAGMLVAGRRASGPSGHAGGGRKRD